MSSVLLYILALAVTSSDCAARRSVDKIVNYPTCDAYTQDLSLNSNDVLGTWYLLHFTTESENGTTDSHCVEFLPVADEERKKLSDSLGNYISLTWENLSLKMQIPCTTDHTNRVRDQLYYLEKLDNEGSYRTLQVPPPKAMPELADFHRYPMRLKMINKVPAHLGMMDCQDEKLSFILARQPSSKDGVDNVLKYLFHKCIKC